MAITAITVNGSAPSNIFPAMILGSARAAKLRRFTFPQICQEVKEVFR